MKWPAGPVGAPVRLKVWTVGLLAWQSLFVAPRVWPIAPDAYQEHVTTLYTAYRLRVGVVWTSRGAGWSPRCCRAAKRADRFPQT